MQTTLDATDLRILSLLQEDASLNAAEVAERVGLSQSQADAGTVRGIRAQVS